jgi:hypothetical protein
MANTNRKYRTNAKKSPKRSKLRPRWTREEVSILRRLYCTHSNADIAEVLGRKVSSVVFKGHRLGLSKGIRRLKEMGKENIRQRWELKKRSHSAARRASANNRNVK